MARLELIVVLALVAFTIFAFIDCILAESSRVRALPKVAWAIIIVLISPFGGILWLVLGKERQGGAGRSVLQRPSPSRAPDDNPAFLRSLSEDKARDARIREIEAQLAELDDDDPKK